MMTRRSFAASGIAAGLAVATAPARAADPRPVVVELFTSQGCSACPPADALLGELAQRRDVVALAFHVDYWDHIGWVDPFGDPLHTARQRAYAARQRVPTIYTPQMVIDGLDQVVGSRQSEVEATIRRHLALGRATRVTIPVQAGRRSDGPVTVFVPAAAAEAPADLLLVAIARRPVTGVERGENAGRTLVGHNVVRSIARVGRWDGADLAVTVRPDAWHRDADELVVLLQAENHGAVWGVTRVAL